MSNFIFLSLFIVISYIIFLFERGNLLVGLAHIPFFNNFSEIINIEKKYAVNNGSDLGVYIAAQKQIKVEPKPNKKPKNTNKKIDIIRQELSSNLKHLEFILAFENRLADLASNDKCSLERLEDFMKIKKDVQLRIIELSQTITYYQSKRINMC